MKLLILTIAFQLCTIFACLLIAQPTYKQLAGDTIITRQTFMNTTYLLNGRKLNPTVMEWFMADYTESYADIRISIISEQVSTGSYTAGALFLFSSVLVDESRPRIINNLRIWGGLGIGGGIIFQLISGSYRKEAVSSYNRDIKQIYRSKAGNFKMNVENTSIKGTFLFEP